MPQRIHTPVATLARTAGLFLLLVGAQAMAGDIVVNIDGVKADGELGVALVWADQKEWPQTVLREVHSQDSTVRLRNLPPGRYALQVFQDTNGNGQLDLSPRGIPLEPVGFSTNPSLLLGKPTPLKCGFEHGAGDTQVQVTLKAKEPKQ